jgi:hypothetical protein
VFKPDVQFPVDVGDSAPAAALGFEHVRGHVQPGPAVAEVAHPGGPGVVERVQDLLDTGDVRPAQVAGAGDVPPRPRGGVGDGYDGEHVQAGRDLLGEAGGFGVLTERDLPAQVVPLTEEQGVRDQAAFVVFEVAEDADPMFHSRTNVTSMSRPYAYVG